MEERNLRMVTSFLESAYNAGVQWLDKELLKRLLDIRSEVKDKLYQVQLAYLTEKE